MNKIAVDKLRYYEKLWMLIRESDVPVPVICASSMAQTIIQGVRKEKTAVNVARKRLELPAYGRLISPIEPIPERPGKVRILFSMTYNGDKL